MIARFAEVKGSRPTPVVSATQEQLKALAKRLQQLTTLAAMQKNQRSTASDALAKKAISKLVGVAPLADDSGKHQGRRSVRGGRRNVRAILYLVAGVVRRHNPEFAEFSERLASRGKRPKVIRSALAHKLLVKLNARARD